MKLIDADALLEIVKQHHDFFSGAMLQADKARRDELSQLMADIVNAPAVDAIPVEWLEEHDGENIGDSDGNTYGRRYITVPEALSMWREEQGVE